MVYLSQGIPFIYYGQELGMTGTSGRVFSIEDLAALGDGMDIPRREAFEWAADINAPGMATWYKDVQPYSGERNIRSGDGISVEEQNAEPGSLLNFYRKLLQLRRSNTTFPTGELAVIPGPNPSVLTYARWNEAAKFLLVFNFAEVRSTTEINVETLPFNISPDTWEMTLSDRLSTFNHSEGKLNIEVVENGFLVLKGG